MRRWAWLLACVLCWVGVLSAQTPTWQAWLYNPPNGDLLRLDASGRVLERATLPLPDGYTVRPFSVAVSPSGNRFAYVVAAQGTSPAQVLVYDHSLRVVLMAYPLAGLQADSISLSGGAAAVFAPDEASLALGYHLRGVGWQIAVIDIHSSQATLLLRGGYASAETLPNGAGVTPLVWLWDGRDASFTLIDTEHNAQELGAFVWVTASSTLLPAPEWNALALDRYALSGELATIRQRGESVFVGRDSSGVLVFRRADERVFTVRFVQGGQVLLIGAIDALGLPRFRLLNRQGELRDWQIAENALIGSIYGTQAGLVYTVDTVIPTGVANQGVTTLYASSLANGADVPLFTSEVSTNPRVIWLADSTLSAPALREWTLLEDSIGEIFQVWVYGDGAAVRINQAGRVVDRATLRIEGRVPTAVSASDDGRFLAFVVAGAGGLPLTLYVYDSERDRMTVSYVLPHDASNSLPAHSIERSPRNPIFDTENSVLALGFGLGNEGWQITLLDAYSGQVLKTLRDDDAAMTPLATAREFGVVPVIQRVQAGRVFFTVQPSGVLRPPYSSFVWDTTADTVNPTLIYANTVSDTLATTGEVVMGMLDDRLPNRAADFANRQLNALHVYSPVTQTRFPFYYDAGVWLGTPRFVQSGAFVLVGGVVASGEAARAVLVARDGRVVAQLPAEFIARDVAGVANGFVAWQRTLDGGQLAYYDTRNGDFTPRTLWQSPVVASQLVWVGYVPQPPPALAWAVLAEPYVVEATVRVADFLGFDDGDSAVVRLLDSATVDIYTQPTTSSPLVTRLRNGTRVTLVGMGQVQDGVLWWRVRTPSGVEGWLVAMLNGVSVLVPSP